MGEQTGAEYEKTVGNTEKETDRKCPSCGGVMDFNPATGGMLCPYCGHEEAVEPETPDFVAKELDFYAAEEDASCDWGTATRTVVCNSCGAQTVYDINEIASECPYCGSNQVMELSADRVMAPGGVVPFKLDAAMASNRFKRWISGKFFCPKLAKDSARPKAFKGMYVPYWTFDSQTSSNYQGHYGRDRVVRRNGKSHVETRWFHTSGNYRRFIDDMLVCGSSRQNEEMLGQVEPFDTSQAVEYRPEYMAGFTAERYTIRMKDAWKTAKGKIQNLLEGEIESKIRQEHHADRVGNVRIQTQFSAITYKYLLLPVWISSFQYKDKVYHFLINGQTGRISGQTPISWIKVGLVSAAAVAAFGILWYLMNA